MKNGKRATNQAMRVAALQERSGRYFQLLRMLLIVSLAMQLIACSRNVRWEEEVPLNNGETIVVKRTGTYYYESESGNPLKFGYRPDSRATIEFTYKGEHYLHTDDARLILLAIAPDGRPNLVASADSYEWQWKHEYHCTTPSYVQFRPDNTGANWTWPDQVEPWLYGQPTNMIIGLPPLESNGRKFTAADRAQHNASVTAAFHEYRRIEPTFQHQNCMRRR
jgi:hypothetical protein